MNRILALTMASTLAAIPAFAQESNRSTSPMGSSSAELRSNNASTTGSLHGTGTHGRSTNASTTGTLRGTGTMKEAEKKTTGSKDQRG